MAYNQHDEYEAPEQLGLYNTSDHARAIELVGRVMELQGPATGNDQLLGRMILVCPEIVAEIAAAHLTAIGA